MPLQTRPFLVVYIAWHPAFQRGKEIAKHLFDHYRREHFGNIAGGAGLSVIYRYASDPATGAPLSIDFEEGETSAVVVLFDDEFSKSDEYMEWLEAVSLSPWTHRLPNLEFLNRLFVGIAGVTFRTHR